MTKQKAIILKIVRDDVSHYTAEEIFALARKELPNISLGTVYRNLGVLVEEGLIRKFNTNNKDIYDKTLNPHGHIICPKCGRVNDFSSNLLDEIFTNELRNRIFSYELMINATCETCYDIK